MKGFLKLKILKLNLENVKKKLKTSQFYDWISVLSLFEFWF